ncbi:hypothetical protein LX64_00939 [Chitinophaga skermanii]|uniref:ATP synthase F0 sector subunit C n=1 Tax=Chitinophaga skermanii TaxID=331697 RepID=A0A327QXD8_9BACT|nr:hypothetical protein [Chitinophaga skermanii]RAJ08292.1 hypothetical protein LX64_00939 [Chitinophaga skermanii]
MNSKQGPSFVLLIVAIIVGVALYKQFDFETKTFAKPALSVVYGITLLVAVTVIVRNLRKK